MKVFKINECDWYMAETLEAAIQQAMEDTGLPRDEAVDNPREEPPNRMQKLIYTDDDGTRRTFQEELARRVAAGAKAEMFASTEY